MNEPTSTSAINTQVGGTHYKNLAIQPLEFCHRNRLGPAESLAIKYIVRHRAKNGREDLEKAIHCLRILIELEYDKPAVNIYDLQNIDHPQNTVA